LIGIFGYTNYSPTKFALPGLAESLVGEVKQDGVAVSIVSPPDTDTPQLHSENKTKPEETKAMTATAKMWSADEVAEIIVKGIEKRKFCIAPGWEMRWLARLHSMIRPVLFWEFDRLARKVRKSRGEP
jgi:3-dehydrosphinganine reductase